LLIAPTSELSRKDIQMKIAPFVGTVLLGLMGFKGSAFAYLHHYTQLTWTPCATSVADDSGSLWLTGCNWTGAGYDIRYFTTGAWANFSGSAIQVSVSANSHASRPVWVINNLGGVYYFDPTLGRFEFQSLNTPGCATSISAGDGDNPWVTGCEAGTEHGVYRWFSFDTPGWDSVGTNYTAHQLSVNAAGTVAYALNGNWVSRYNQGVWSWVGMSHPGGLRWIDFSQSTEQPESHGTGIGTDGQIYSYDPAQGWIEPQPYSGPPGCYWTQVSGRYALDSCGNIYVNSNWKG
jgi:hypothetical protein